MSIGRGAGGETGREKKRHRKKGKREGDLRDRRKRQY